MSSATERHGLAVVTGATGFVGRRLVERLIEREVPIRVLTRTGNNVPAAWRNTVDIAVCNLTDERAIRQAVSGVSHLYNLAGSASYDCDLFEVNAYTPERLVKVAISAGVSKVLHMSTVSVTGHQPNGIVDESCGCSPMDVYGRSKLAGEISVSKVLQQHSISGVVLRPSEVFGEGRSRVDKFVRLALAIKQRRVVLFGAHSWANYIYVEDLVDCCLAAMDNASVEVPAFFVNDPATMVDFYDAIASALGVAPPRLVLPEWAGHTAALAVQTVCRAARWTPPLTVPVLRGLTRKYAFSPEALFRSWRHHFRYGYRDGWSRTVAWYREQKLLS